MKVYLSTAKRLKSLFPNFKEWESIMIQKYGSGITSKTNEIWKQLLQKEKDIINSPSFIDEAKKIKIQYGDYYTWQKTLIAKYGVEIQDYLIKVWNEIDVNSQIIDTNIIKGSAQESGENFDLSDDDFFMNKLLFLSKLFSIILLILSLYKLPIGYYTFLRIIVCGTFGFAALYYYSNEIKNKYILTWVFGIVALIFNPFFPIYIGKKNIWSVIDIITAIILAISIILLREFPFRFKKKFGKAL